MTARAPFAVAVTAIALIVSACGSPGSPDDAETPAPTVTVTITPEAEAGTDADFGFTFFEEGQMGATWDQLGAQLNYPVAGIEECPWYATVWNTELATTHAFSDPAAPGSGVVFFYTNRFLAADDAPFPRNAEGVGVGSTQAEILAAYPGAVVDSYTDLGAGDLTRITVDDPESDSKYVFAISSGSAVVDLLQWGPDAGNQWSHLCIGL